MIKIAINGQSQKIEDAQTLEKLITSFSSETRHIIAELNGEIIKSDRWASQKMSDGDSLELVTFVGGG